MYDSGKIILGLAVFVLLITFPIWHNNLIGTGGAAPVKNSELPEAMFQSISFPNGARHSLTTQEMRATHMDMLKDIHGNAAAKMAGQKDKMPNMQCLMCHVGSNEQPLQFCDSCHNSVSVKVPDCWACHTKP
jgi:hypothetical protein